jgi:hypothetical protein
MILPTDRRIHSLPPYLHSLGKRVLAMTLLWSCLGIVVGVNTAPFDQGTIRIVSGAIAGVIVLFPVGAMLGLFSDGIKMTLLGAAAGGLLAGLTGAVLSWGFAPSLASVGLLGGGLIGATLSTIFHFARWLANQNARKAVPTDG